MTDNGRNRLLVLGQLTAPPKQVEVTAKEAQGAIGSGSQVGIIRCGALGSAHDVASGATAVCCRAADGWPICIGATAVFS